MSDNKKLEVKCPLCGGGIVYSKDLDGHSFYCLRCNCDFIFDALLSYTAALARFQQKPESAWEMFRRLENKYGEEFAEKIATYFNVTEFANGIVCLLLNKSEQEAIAIMQQIEKDLKE